MPSDAEMCEVRAAEYRRKAAEGTDRFVKDKFLEIAQEWQELSTQFNAMTWDLPSASSTAKGDDLET